VDAFNKVSAVFRKRDSSSSGYLDCKEFWGALCDLFRFIAFAKSKQAMKSTKIIQVKSITGEELNGGDVL